MDETGKTNSEVAELMTRLESELIGKRVVQLWFGHGEVAFVGFGDTRSTETNHASFPKMLPDCI